MNKTELIDTLSRETTYSKNDIAYILEALARVVKRTLKNGDKLQWSGFGTFAISRRPARKGINPVTKEKINLPETFVPKFKAGKQFKEEIRVL